MVGKGLRLALLVGACVALPAGAQTDDGQSNTLQEALTQAYLSNPTLMAARSNLRATDETVPLERADALPTVSVAPSYSENLYSSSGNSGAIRTLGAQLSLGVPIYAGGGVRSGILAAETRVLAGRADLRGTESAIFSQVVAAYMDVIQNEAIVALSANNVEVLSVNLQATSDRYEIGDLTRTDVAQSQARLALAQGDLRTAQSNLVRARENFIALVGEAPVELQPPPPLPGLPANVDDAVDIALVENPDLLATQERARAAGYDIRVAGASRLPRIDVTTGGGAQTSLGSIPPSLTGFVQDNEIINATAGVRATIPLFQGGRPAALERQAQARRSSALEQIVAAERDVIAQVRASYASWQAAGEIIASTESAVSAAELSLEGVQAESTVGNRTILDILNAQQEVLRAQVQLVAARRNAYVAGFSLLAAMGRGEARDLGIAASGPLYDPVVNYRRVRNNINDWSSDADPVTQSTRTVDIPAQDADIPVQGPVLPVTSR